MLFQKYCAVSYPFDLISVPWYKILRFAQNDKGSYAQNDKGSYAQNDKGSYAQNDKGS
jgi:hypothetical protein